MGKAGAVALPGLFTGDQFHLAHRRHQQDVAQIANAGSRQVVVEKPMIELSE